MWWPGKKRRRERKRLEAERQHAREVAEMEARQRRTEAERQKRLLDPREQEALRDERMHERGLMVTCWRCGSYTPSAKKCRTCNVFLETA